MKGGKKYFEWIGQLDCQSGINLLNKREYRLPWSRISREAYARGHMRESNRKDSERFNRILRKQNEPS